MKELLKYGYSLITADENKVPNLAWKKYQTSQISESDFEKQLAKSNTKYVGLVTGYNGVEVIDVDLKVFPEKAEAKKFWTDFVQLLNDNIEDFETKFVIAKTINNGYHILYRCNSPDGNKKIAKTKYSKEAIIETRGVGGYVVIYDADYENIKLISDEDRDILFACCHSMDYAEDEKIDSHDFDDVKISPWADYNDKTNIWDLVYDEFQIVKKTSNATLIKRNGAKSTHSGYLYNNNRIYLFSTGTQYPAEKLLSPFGIYAIKYHNGNHAEAGRKLYYDGFGSRNNNKIFKEEKVNPIKVLDFPVDIFPDIIKNYIYEVGNNANFSKDFLSVAVLSTLSTVLGRKIKIKVNNAWETYPIFWFAAVGGPGSKKTHPVKFAIRPLKKLDIKNKEKYDKEFKEYEKYQESDDFQKKEMERIKKPTFYQYVVKDATIEALFYVHDINRNGIMLYKDELIGFIKGMGQYKGGAGEDMEQYLSLFDGDEIKKNRVTKEPLLIPDTCINLIGTIQSDVIDKIPRENGFLQRFLFTNADNKIKRYNATDVSKEVIDSYDNFVFQINNTVLNTPETIEYILTPDALTEFMKTDNYLCNLQESDESDKFLKQYIEKLKTYLPRFALIIAVLNSIEKSNNYALVDAVDMIKASKLTKYFISSAKFLIHEQEETKEIRNISKSMNGLSNDEKVINLLKKGLNKTKIADEVGISRKNVYEIIKRNNL